MEGGSWEGVLKHPHPHRLILTQPGQIQRLQRSSITFSGPIQMHSHTHTHTGASRKRDHTHTRGRSVRHCKHSDEIEKDFQSRTKHMNHLEKSVGMNRVVFTPHEDCRSLLALLKLRYYFCLKVPLK